MQPGIPAIPFALVPTQASHNVIEYLTRKGQSLFRSATQNLYSESSEMFDCDPDVLMDFIQLVEDRSNMLGSSTNWMKSINTSGSQSNISEDSLQRFCIADRKSD